MLASDTIIPFIRRRKRILSIKCSKCSESKRVDISAFISALGQIAAWAVGLWGDGWCRRGSECFCPECAWGR